MKRSFNQLFGSALLSALLLVLLAYLTFLASSTPGWLNPVLFALAAAAWLIGGRASAGIELPGTVFLMVLLAASFLAYDPRRSFDQVWSISAGFLILFSSAAISRSDRARSRLVAFLLLLGGLAMVWSWWDASRWYQAWLAAEPGRWLPTISFRLNGSNNLAAYYNMLLMPALAFVVWGRRKWPRILMGGYALSALLLIFLTSSRGGWFGTAAGCAVLLFLALLRARLPLMRLLRDRRVWAAGCAGLVVVLGLGWLYLFMMQSHPTHASFFDARAGFWPPAWEAFLQSPVWGQGLNVYASFQMRVYSYPPQPIYLHAHNQYLDILMGAGILGAAAFIWLMARLGQVFWQRWRGLDQNDAHSGQISPAVPPQDNAAAGLAILAGAGAALAAYLVHGIFDGLYRMPFTSITLAVLLGAGLASRRVLARRALAEQALAGWVKIGMAVVWTALAAYGAWNTWRTTPLYEAVDLFGREELAESTRARFDEAALRDPANAAVHQQRGVFYSLLAAGGDPAALTLAVSAMERAAVLDPTWGLNYANLGALYRAEGRISQAEEEFQRAVRAAPGAALFWLNYAEVLESAGKLPEARAAYQKVLELQPGLFPAAYWRAAPLRRELAPPRQAPPLDRTALVSLTESGNAWAVDFARLSALYRQAGQLEEADRGLKKARLAYYLTLAEPLELIWEEAELRAARGDLPGASQAGENALNGLRQQGVYGPGSFGKVEYIPSVFGIPSIAPDLVPQLTPLPLTDLWAERWARLSGWYASQGKSDLARLRQEEALRLSGSGSR